MAISSAHLSLVPEVGETVYVDEPVNVRQELAETVLYLQGKAERFERARDGAVYAVVIRKTIRTLDRALRRLR